MPTRRYILLFFLIGFCDPAYTDEPSAGNFVEQRLLEIRLASYLTAYETAMAARDDVELQIVQTVDAAILEQLNGSLDRLNAHLEKLEKQTRVIAKQVEELSSETSQIQAREIADMDQAASLPPDVRAENLLQTMNRAIDFPGRALRDTKRTLDVAIDGPGYFAVVDSERSAIAYTRLGNLNVKATGHLVAGTGSTGLQLAPPIRIPKDAEEVVISGSGVVSCRMPGDVDLQRVGQIRVAVFAQPKALRQTREDLFAESNDSGPAKLMIPGEHASGTLRQGYLEVADSDRIRELIDVLNAYLRKVSPAVDSVEKP